MKAKFFLPNSLTAMNLIFAVFAIVQVVDNGTGFNSIITAGWLICLAGVFDGLDGKVARITNTQSRFGVEFDSIADFAAFVLAPAFVGYRLMSMSNLDEKMILLSIVIYILGGAIRLARFNVVQGGEKEKGLFLGLPTPAGAGNIVGLMFFSITFYGSSMNIDFVTKLFFVNFIVTGILMVSNVRYDNVFSMFKANNPKFLIMKKIPLQLAIFAILLVYTIVVGHLELFLVIALAFYHVKAIFLNLHTLAQSEA